MSEPFTPEAYIAYVREHHAGLRAFVRSLGVDPMWVDDVAQEAFVTAYDRLEFFDSSRDFGAWVRGIARNLVINERRKDARRKRILSDNLTDILVATSGETGLPEDIETAEENQEKLIALKHCLQEMPEKSREIVKARYEQGKAAPDIALALGMKSDAVRKTLERLRLALRKCMERQLEAHATS
ncbi:MAG: sigma-70 family RNA polymerase sigma factor [Verrucomicrobiales bacterium]|nr:sigma-70 family RNA polymerase sigma factor [Verrucomicrobiales bacterium]